jgi:epoxyqueuosine reductase
MRRCENRQPWSRACPTGAIDSDRFLIRAERCITFHNERLGEFPAWLDASWHNCLEGCIDCQRVCPKNANFRDWVEGNQTFSEEETNLILKSTPRDRLPDETARKLAQLSLLETRTYWDAISRRSWTRIDFPREILRAHRAIHENISLQ